MNLKKIKIISIIGIFLLSFIVHYGYELLPSFISSIFFPINESLFEHMKLIVTCYLLWGFIENKLLKDNKNFKSNLIISILINIIVFLLIFYPIYLTYDHNLILTLSIYLISIIITQFISYFILKSNKVLFLNKYFYIIMAIIIIVNIIFTYYPINNNFFIDYMNKKIGFSNYY